MARRLTLPRRVSTALEGLDFTAQVFRFCQDVLTFLEAAKTRLETLETAGTGAHASTHLPVSGSDPLPVGTGADQFVAGNDSRLSDDRTASGLRSATTVVGVSAATAPTAGQILKATSGTTATWQTHYDAGSEFFVPPVTPHATLDDEFLGTSLDAKWTVYDSAGATVAPTSPVTPYSAFVGGAKVSVGRTYWTSWLQIQVGNNGTFFALAQPHTVPANMFIWARICAHRDGAVANNEGVCTLAIFGDSAGAPDYNNMVYCGYQPDASNPRAEFGKYTAGVGASVQLGNNGGIAQGPVYEYYGIQKVGTTYHGWAFSGTRSLTYMGSTTFAPAVAHVGFWLINVASNPGNPMAGIDFFRVVDNSSDYLP